MSDLFRINHNVMSGLARRNINRNETIRETAERRLSSGLRINRAQEDVVGLSISETLRRTMSGLNRGQKNAQDGISMIQTAESAYDEIQNKLNRLKELSVQAASDTLTDADRELAHNEARSIVHEVNRLRDATEFNGIKLLHGGIQEADLSLWGNIDTWQEIEDAMASGGGVINISASIVAPGTETPAGTATDLDQLDDNIVDIREHLDKAFQWWSDRFEAASGVSFHVDWMDETDEAPPATADSNGTPLDSGPRNNFTAEGNAGQFRFMADPNEPSAARTWTTDDPDRINERMLKAGNIQFNPNFNWGEDDDPDTYSFRWGAIHSVGVALGFPQLPPGTIPDSIMDLDWTQAVEAADFTGSSEEAAIREFFNTGRITPVGEGVGEAIFHVGANRDDIIRVDFERVDSRSLGVWCVNLTTRERANRSIERIERAAARLSEIRSSMGASEKRLENALDFARSQNETSQRAESRIRDADMAKEITDRTRAQIISQNAINVLGRANTDAEMALRLL